MTLWMIGLALAADPEVEPASAGEETEPEEMVVGPDRLSPPAVIPAEWLELDAATKHDLGGGRTAYHVRVPGVRKVEVGVRLHRGTYELDGWRTELAQGVGDLADVATAQHDAVTFEILQDVHDMWITSWIGNHSGGIGLDVPLEDLALGLEMVGNVLHDPIYPKQEVKRHLRDRRLYFEVEGPASLTRVAWAALAYAWYPADHPYGARPDLSQMKKLSGKALAARQLEWRTSGPVSALVVGDVAWEEVEPLLVKALEGIGTDGDWAPDLEITPPSMTRVVGIDMPGQAQAALRLRFAAPKLEDLDRIAFEAMNWAFGGHFLSRLNSNLREEKGFTYGAGSDYDPDRTHGNLTVSVDVKVENIGAAITEIEGEIARLYSDGVSAEELDMARQSSVSEWNGTRETASTADRLYYRLMVDKESVEEALARKKAVEDVKTQDTKHVAAKWLSKEAPRLWIVAGDRAQIEPQLEALGWTVEWITPQQAILGDI